MPYRVKVMGGMKKEKEIPQKRYWYSLMIANRLVSVVNPAIAEYTLPHYIDGLLKIEYLMPREETHYAFPSDEQFKAFYSIFITSSLTAITQNFNFNSPLMIMAPLLVISTAVVYTTPHLFLHEKGIQLIDLGCLLSQLYKHTFNQQHTSSQIIIGNSLQMLLKKAYERASPIANIKAHNDNHQLINDNHQLIFDFLFLMLSLVFLPFQVAIHISAIPKLITIGNQACKEHTGYELDSGILSTASLLITDVVTQYDLLELSTYNQTNVFNHSPSI